MKRLLVLVVVASTCELARATVAIGVGWTTSTGDAALYDVDLTTGNASNPRPIDVSPLHNLTSDASGALYTIVDDGSRRLDHLYRVDQLSGASTHIAELNFSLTQGGLTYSAASGELIAVEAAQLGANGLMLYAIDPQGGVTRGIGRISGTQPVTGLSFDALGRLFLLNGPDAELHELDPQTGEIVSTVAVEHVLASAGSMVYDESIDQFIVGEASQAGGVDMLYTLNRFTGGLTPIGPSGAPFGLAGLAVVPEPSSLTMLVGGTALLDFVRRRKRTAGRKN